MRSGSGPIPPLATDPRLGAIPALVGEEGVGLTWVLEDGLGKVAEVVGIVLAEVSVGLEHHCPARARDHRVLHHERGVALPAKGQRARGRGRGVRGRGVRGRGVRGPWSRHGVVLQRLGTRGSKQRLAEAGSLEVGNPSSLTLPLLEAYPPWSTPPFSSMGAPLGRRRMRHTPSPQP